MLSCANDGRCPQLELQLTEFVVEVRHYCRNPRCRSRLPAPVANAREAFCTRGCYNSFYLHRCLVCERQIEQPIRGRRLICGKASCRNDLRANLCLGRYRTSSDAELTSQRADFIGVKDPHKLDQYWRIVASGPGLTRSGFHCATVGAEDAVERANRNNGRYWREATAKTKVRRHNPPVSILDGDTFSDASVVDLTPSPSSRGLSVLTGDSLDIPDFLRRSPNPETRGLAVGLQALGDECTDEVVRQDENV